MYTTQRSSFKRKKERKKERKRKRDIGAVVSYLSNLTWGIDF
jgi:hypothetical protein